MKLTVFSTEFIFDFSRLQVHFCAIMHLPAPQPQPFLFFILLLKKEKWQGREGRREFWHLENDTVDFSHEQGDAHKLYTFPCSRTEALTALLCFTGKRPGK